MEAQQGSLMGGRGVQRTERVCSREEKKRRRTSGLVEDRASGQQRYPSFSSASSSSYDDRSSATSGLDVADRLTYLEQRMQMQEDEIQLLKLALADVLKRLNISEEHQAAAAAAAGRKTPGAKARPVSLALPPRTSMSTSSSTSLKKSSTVPSSATARNYSPAPPPLSGVKSPPGSAKDSPCKITKPRPASAASVCKKVPEESNKSSEPAVSVGTRRVTHCKVTMQIYLSPLARKTGSSEEAKSASAMPAYKGPVAGPGPPLTKRGGQPLKKKSTPSFTLNLQKTVTGQSSAQEMSSYISPVKSPSQYFQICY
ncbi:echinoderm microtubule-associated protein-like 1 isoform X1 [Poecilia latipinna]|uniref:echinoderm microtubule-associated protein-like 1 isoform X1 n=1 Tax=Poecilia latipinna TaxID=48699 RepID=UPI00072DD4B5|nr:PREDICTED: echinoderm microtubule-associated protein-like 1 isoform X1 [Poecilia latipinna]